jgi:small GTP-binding protein
MLLQRGAKVIFIGSISVGKTSLMVRIAENRFDGQTEPTTCASYAQYSPPEVDSVVLRFCDTAGLERYRAINRIYYRDAAVVLLTFDLSDRRTFDDVGRWKEEFEKEASVGHAIVILVGNKCDRLQESQVPEEEA